MNIKLQFECGQIKSIKFHKNGKLKKEVYYSGIIVEYDENGNEIYYRNSYKDEIWKEYDERGNKIHYKDSRGVEYWWEYDEKRNTIYYKVNGRVIFDHRENKGEYQYRYNIII